MLPSSTLRRILHEVLFAVILILPGAAVSFCASPASAASLGVITGPYATLTSGSGPTAIVAGPDGNLWFTESTTSAIGRITPSGTVSEFQLASGADPTSITVGPDGNLWFTERSGNSIGMITPSGTISTYSTNLSVGAEPTSITAGPDGALWFTEYGTGKIGRITPSGTITEFSIGSSSKPYGITTGPDGALWITDDNATTNSIDRMTTTGSVVAYSTGLTAGSVPEGIALGPDGNLWFTEFAANRIGQTTPGGAIAEFQIPHALSDPSAITPGPDGDMWFTESSSSVSQVGRITLTGSILQYPVFGGTGSPSGIATGPDGNVWVTDGAHQIESVGADVPAASIAEPEVSGPAEAGLTEICGGDRWANWAGQQPGSPSYQWLLDGADVSGATSSQFTPPSADVRDTLSCSVTVTYGLVAVTETATSATVTLVSETTGPMGPAGAVGAQGQTGPGGAAGANGAAGAAGANGAAGAAGANGAAGAQGPAGPRGEAGPTGEVELVTCTPSTHTITVGGVKKSVTETVCTTKVVTKPVTFTSSTAPVRLVRGAKEVAHGVEMSSGRTTRILIDVAHRLAKGSYELKSARGATRGPIQIR